MQKNILILVLLVIIGGGAYAFIDGNKESTPTMVNIMEDNMLHGSMNVSSDQEFIVGMIPHHQEAIDTAKEVLARGGVIPEIKTLAENIIVAQEKEISDMRNWYKEWFGEDVPDPGTYMAMMRELSDLSGKELDIAFTTDMIMHHMGALHMGQQALQFSEREEIITLSNNILKTQAEEIQLMRTILADN